MAIQGKTVAMFINTQNMVEVNTVLQQCRQLESVADIFVTDRCSTSLKNFGMDVNAKYSDYDYVIIINPFEKAEEETENTLLWRQKYYLNNMVLDEKYLEKQISALEASPLEGMLVPYIDYIKSINKDLYKGWKDYYKQTEAIIKKNDLDVIIAKDQPPVISEGGCAIIKTSAIRGFENLKTEIYDAEVILYVLSLYMQSNGYLPGYSMKESYMVHNLMGYGAMNRLEVQHGYPTRKLISEIYFDIGKSFEVSKAQSIEYIYKVGKKEKLKFKIDVPKGTKHIRFDPLEGNMCLCSGITTDIEGVKVHNFNGLRLGKEDLFLTKDPQYILEGDFSQVKTITIIMDYMSIFWSENGLQDEMDKFFEEKEELIKSIEYLKTVYGELETVKNKEIAELSDIVHNMTNTNRALKCKLAETDGRSIEQQNRIGMLQNELDAIKATKGWKFICKARNVKQKLFRKFD